ncbi:hypothetical protein [Candidatus Galacturonibacter soehngenii]|uniref:Uncharacterized protein n=1 Tax=Candidatus Galacturonatibacter soehngenii TaxID=2307010 RepID=A0A7V7QI13_9FIRM|nr:hypothetical protein [Candidatus Galacturonibacter soehngenii]KAB1434389.1 hypothetical protein F7O84_18045 [Candidatus Galacturonibacter soehngenii]
MKDKIILLFEKYGKLFVLLCIAIAIIGIIASYLFPNESFDSSDINIEENADFKIPLTQGSVVEYNCNTGKRPMAGIQVFISKEGAEFSDGKVHYEVYNKDGSVHLGSGEQLLKDIADGQFVYLPFKGMKECMGDIKIKFFYTGSESIAPALIANQDEIEEVSTIADGTRIKGNIKASYIYINETHPLVFDLKIMLAVFMTVFFTLESKKKQKANEAYE